MLIVKTKKIDYAQIIYKWLAVKKGEVDINNLKEQSYIKYYDISKRVIIPKLGNKNFNKLNVKEIQNFFNNEEITNLALSTQKTVFYIISASSKYGKGKGYKTNLKEINIKLKTPKAKIVYLTKHEQNKVENLLSKKKGIKALGILMCLYTGLRIGELCALRWKDIDLENKCYRIEHTVQRVKNLDKNSNNKTKLIVCTPKTISSKRIVPIPNFLIPLLKKYKNDDNIFVFSEKKVPRDPRTFESYFERVLKKCDIKNKNFHSLRHTFATRSLEAGIDIKTLSEILGHSSYRITLDIYVHSSFELKKDSLNELVNYLNKGKHQKIDFSTV